MNIRIKLVLWDQNETKVLHSFSLKLRPFCFDCCVRVRHKPILSCLLLPLSIGKLSTVIIIICLGWSTFLFLTQNRFRTAIRLNGNSMHMFDLRCQMTKSTTAYLGKKNNKQPGIQRWILFWSILRKWNYKKVNQSESQNPRPTQIVLSRSGVLFFVKYLRKICVTQNFKCPVSWSLATNLFDFEESNVFNVICSPSSCLNLLKCYTLPISQSIS